MRKGGPPRGSIEELAIDSGLLDLARPKRIVAPVEEGCIAGDPEVVDIAVTTLPTVLQAGDPVSKYFGGGVRGIVMAIAGTAGTGFGGVTWSRGGRASVSGMGGPSKIPLVPLAAIPISPEREIYLRQTSTPVSASNVTLLFVPVGPRVDLSDPRVLVAIAQQLGGIGYPPPRFSYSTSVNQVIVEIRDQNANPVVTTADNADAVAPVGQGLWRVWSELAAFDGTNFDRLRTTEARGTSGAGRLLEQDTWLSPQTSSVINTNNAGATTLYTCPTDKVARVFLSGYISSWTGAATLEIRRSGGAFDRYVTAAVGALFRNIGPYLLTDGTTLDVNVTTGGVGSLTVHVNVEERWEE